MYYTISIILVVTGLFLALYGNKYFNISLSISFAIPNLAIVYYLDDMFIGSNYLRYAYYFIILISILILLFAKIFTYIYSYWLLVSLMIFIAAIFSVASGIDSTQYIAWVILLGAGAILILIRKYIKKIIIGSSSGYMVGLGIASIGFRSIFNLGWEYFLDFIILPGGTIVLCTMIGLAYQFAKSRAVKDEGYILSPKQVNTYFGLGTGVLFILVLVTPLFLGNPSENRAEELAEAYCECLNRQESEKAIAVNENCQEAIGYFAALEEFSSLNEKTNFTARFLKEISNCSVEDRDLPSQEPELTKSSSEQKFKDTEEVSISKAEIEDFVKQFYSSLELSKADNQKAYFSGDVKFDNSKFLKLLASDAIYSKKRVNNLCGPYHDRYNISLIKIESINQSGSVFKVKTLVEYVISGLGVFYNNEVLKIHKVGRLEVVEWDDLSVENMKVGEYEGLENFSEEDFYKAIGQIKDEYAIPEAVDNNANRCSEFLEGYEKYVKDYIEIIKGLEAEPENLTLITKAATLSVEALDWAEKVEGCKSDEEFLEKYMKLQASLYKHLGQ